MKQETNVIKLKQKNPMYQEETILIMNLAQILLAVVREHGASTTLTAIQGMIQDAQKTVNAERQAKPKSESLPLRNLKSGGTK